MMARKKPATPANNDEVVEAAAAAIGRFLTGAPMDGVRRTDATWTHRGTRSTRPDGRAANRWDHLSRWEKIGVRQSFVAAAAGTVYGYINDATATTTGLETSGLAAGSAAAAYVGWRTMDGAITWRHRRDWIWPLHLVLQQALNLPEGTKPSSYISISANFTEITGEAVRITVPAHWSGDNPGKAAVQSAITTKLALQDIKFSWKLDGRDHFVTVTQSPRPPSKVLFADPAVQQLIMRSPESAPLIGLSHRGTVVSVDLDAESPHVLVSAGTGGGKSVILRCIFAQLLHNGAIGVVLDRKRHSHKWVRGVPGVEYCRDIEDIHETLIALGAEGERRNRIVDDWEEEGDAPVGPRMAILLEEVNATIGKLKRYWTSIRDPKTDPKESPAIDALAEILFMGRAVKMHVLAVGQSMTANSMGGPEMRENFATRILARYTRNAWNMLVPEVQPAPKATRHIGRAQVVLGGSAHETQVCFFTDAEAREWAMAGRTVTTSQGHSTPTSLAKDAVTVTAPEDQAPEETTSVYIPQQADGVRLDSFVQDMEAAWAGPAGSDQAEKPISLSQAIKDGILTVSISVARQNANGKRDGEFPPSVGIEAKTNAKLYYPSALAKWERNRPKSKQAEASE
jgi:hypothetical protein